VCDTENWNRFSDKMMNMLSVVAVLCSCVQEAKAVDFSGARGPQDMEVGGDSQMPIVEEPAPPAAPTQLSWAARAAASASVVQPNAPKANLLQQNLSQQQELKLRFECAGPHMEPKVHGLWFKDRKFEETLRKKQNANAQERAVRTWAEFVNRNGTECGIGAVLNNNSLWEGSHEEKMAHWGHEWFYHGQFVQPHVEPQDHGVNSMTRYLALAVEFKNKVRRHHPYLQCHNKGLIDYCGRLGQAPYECTNQ